jgi:hypothetical protein
MGMVMDSMLVRSSFLASASAAEMASAESDLEIIDLICTIPLNRLVVFEEAP